MVTLHLHPGRLDEVFLFQVATIRDVVPLVEYTVEVVRQRPLAEFVNAVQQCIEQELIIRGHTVLQLVMVLQNLCWQAIPSLISDPGRELREA